MEIFYLKEALLVYESHISQWVLAHAFTRFWAFARLESLFLI